MHNDLLQLPERRKFSDTIERWHGEYDVSIKFTYSGSKVDFQCGASRLQSKFSMQRVTMTLGDELGEYLERMIARHGYQNRSEAIRDFTRADMRQAEQKSGQPGDCVAALVYVCDHAAHDLSIHLVENYLGHRDLSPATLHMHLNIYSCMEVTALQRSRKEMQHFANHIFSERSVQWPPNDDPCCTRKEGI